MTDDKTAEDNLRMRRVSYPDVAGRAIDDMSHAEARLVIIRHVGLNLSPWSHFGKADMNSVYRYLTGEFYFPTRDYYTSDSPSTGEVREAVAAEAGLDYDRGPDGNRPYTLKNVRNLARKIRQHEDKRHE